jgi:hypothetical protein
MAAPQVGLTIPNQTIRYNKDFSYTVGLDRFTDADGDIVSVTATYADNSPLESWWGFTAGNGSTVLASFVIPRITSVVGVYSIKITATDATGGTASQTKTFTVTANNTPTLAVPLVDQTFYYGDGAPSTQTYQFGNNDFSDDPDNEGLTYTAYVQSGGADVALPTGITFNGAARKFTATAASLSGSAGTYTVRVYASDGLASVYDEFEMVIRTYNQPVVANYTPEDVTGYSDEAFAFEIDGIFTDPDPAPGQVLEYSATLLGGGALPAWLSVVGTELVGTPAVSDEGTITVTITASDGENTASVDLVITIQAYANPTVVTTIPDLTVKPNQTLGYIIPFDYFSSSGGEELSYEVTTVLPSWLVFDTTKRRFLGTPANGNAGDVVNVTVRASDSLGFVDDSFTITVGALATNLITRDNRIPNQYLQTDETLNYTFPANIFSASGGGTITYEAWVRTPKGTKDIPLSYGAPWISFNAATRTFTGTPESLQGLKTKSYQIFIKAISDDGDEEYEGFVITVGETDNVGAAMAKTTAEARYTFRWEGAGAIRVYDNGVASGYMNNSNNNDLNIDFSTSAITTVGTGATTITLDLQPGDTIGLRTDVGVTGGKILLKGVSGTAGAPVYLTNVEGNATFFKEGTGVGYCVKPQNNNHLVIFGQGTYATPCGLKIGTGAGGSSAIQYNNDNHNGVEIAYVHINQSSFAGISVKNQLEENNGQRGTPNVLFPWRDDMQYVCIHHNLVEDTEGEAIYCGYGFYHTGKVFNGLTKYPHDIRYVEIHDNECYNIGWDAVQFKNTVENCRYYNNFIHRSSVFTRSGQNEGANITEGFSGEFFNNVVIDGGQSAIWLGASGNCMVHHNIFVNFRSRAIYGALRGRTDDVNLSNIPNSSQYARVFNNTFIDVADPTVTDKLVEITTPLDLFVLKNNLFITRSGGPSTITINTPTTGASEEEGNNIILGNKSLARFRDAVNWDYTPLAGSPAESAGTDLSAYGVTEDYYGNTINWSDVTVGALQVGGTALDYRFERIAAQYLAPNTPTAPSGLTATVISDTRVDLAWTDNATDEEAYEVQYKLNAGSTWTTFETLGVNAVSSSITGLTAASAYNFRVRATNVAGNSAYITANATTSTAAAAAPEDPTNLALVETTDTTISLTWILNSTNESEVTIEREVSGVWGVIETLASGTESHTLTGLDNSTEYILRVIASNSAGDSNPTNTVTTETTAEPTTVGVMYAYADGDETLFGFASSELLIPTSIKSRDTFRLIDDTRAKTFPTSQFFKGKEGITRKSGDTLAICVANNYWEFIDLARSSSWADLEGSPSLNADLDIFVQGKVDEHADKLRKIAIPKATHTGDIVETTLATLVIPAGTVNVGSIITIRPVVSWNAGATFNILFKVKIGAVELINTTLNSGRSYKRTQEILIVDGLNTSNNTVRTIPSGTSTQEGLISSDLSKDQVDWTSSQSITFTVQLASGSDTFTFWGAVVEIISESDIL